MQKRKTSLYSTLTEEFNKFKKKYGKDIVDEVNKNIQHIKKGNLLNYYYIFDKIEYDNKFKQAYYWLDLESIQHLKSIAIKTPKLYKNHLGYISKMETYDIFVSNNFMAFVWIEEIKKKVGEG